MPEGVEGPSIQPAAEQSAEAILAPTAAEGSGRSHVSTPVDVKSALLGGAEDATAAVADPKKADWDDPTHPAYLTPEEKATNPKVIQDSEEAVDVGDASNRTRSRAALERQTEEAYRSEITDGMVRSYESQLHDNQDILKYGTEGTPKYEAAAKAVKMLEDLLPSARADVAREQAGRGELKDVYGENTDKENYRFESTSDRSETIERYDELAERQEKWAGVLYRNPEVAKDWKVSGLMHKEDRIQRLRWDAKKVDEKISELEQKRRDPEPKFDAHRGLAQLEFFDHFFKSGIANIAGERIDEVLRDETKTVKDVNDAFFDACKSVVEGMRNVADQDEKWLDELANGSAQGPEPEAETLKAA
ncbi:MAG TPA: hypothetical protein VM077_05510 [Candidatus Limnocylindrales bacterium]|nr:hypothetical protein [Candidatus Limnocylindrales bacterium]